MNLPGWIDKKRDALLVTAFVGITLLICGLIGYLKYDTLYAWGYTSDLFTFDTVLQEILNGHFGLEFTFANTFGDHAEPFLVLLLPFKLLMQTRMVDILIQISPVGLFIGSVVMFFAMRSSIGTWKAFLLALSLVFGFSLVMRGSFEEIYGFHPDTISGYVAIAFTSCLILYDGDRSRGLKTKLPLLGFWLCFAGYLSLKEEMALLAAIYFLIAMFFQRNRLHLMALLLAAAVFIAEYCMILIFQTPYNRSNSALLSGVINGIQTDGIKFFVHNPHGDSNVFFLYWGVIFSGLAVFILSNILSRKRNMYAACLFFTGLTKMILSFFVADFDIFTWHNFPGLMMIIAAGLWQISMIDRPSFLGGSILPAFILMISITLFLWRDIPFFQRTITTNRELLKTVMVYNNELEEIKPLVPVDRVVAIPAFSVVQWVGYRYSFYPRGLSESPVAIADYVVYPNNIRAKFTAGSDQNLPLDEIKDDFQVVHQTFHFRLLKRIAIRDVDRSNRERFYRMVGLESNMMLP